MSSKTLEDFDGIATSGSRDERGSIWRQMRLWRQRMSKGERRAVAATMATTFILIGLMLVTLYLSLRGYVIHLGSWPA